MKNKAIYWLIAAISILLIVLATVFFVYESKNKCNYNDANKVYLKKEKNCVINFLCTKDKQAFSDSCGCGCKTITG